MCRQTTCPTCKKASWSGCGQHVEQVLGHLSADQRCAGHPEQDGLAASFVRRILGG